ncbi:6-phosphogluconate dehydrogenase C-terminal domain-like protein [Cryphonectria parasitica EP155]|uniref:6-phosphogluconate dehydrogenase C-terminal domain-like protein n=1 Tax=Cryphonectria parasitica (strain ATCC 38755 / EP155) TaxID=660469 RepID=A0A9P4YCA8_CRYP1|nr:6-phosphogluconate dehydrogenase C-terminal domain-like protein [Cryphonectria parasitica EP155]KAF3770426.1 6-phosphogluconate dehydrogenase C-terminal domain-like protein [Cryphonectria parasitica EP155]
MRAGSEANEERRMRSFTKASRDTPPWLHAILNDSKPPPISYAWTLDNLGSQGAPRSGQAYLSSAHRKSESRIFVLGLGNLGRLYATCLSQLSNPPPITLVVHRRSLLEHWASDPGIEMTRYGHTERLSNFDVEWWTPEKPSVGPVREVVDGGRISNLIVATKAPAAIPEVDRLRRYLDGSSTVLFVQNGMNRLWPPHGTTYFTCRYPDGRHPTFLHGVTMHGVFSEGPFKSVHAAPAGVVVGPVCSSDEQAERPSYLTRLIATAPHLAGQAVPRPELWILQLEKLVVNMIINPLTAILRVRNGVLFADPDGKTVKIMDELLRETSDVLQALIQHESSQEIMKDGNMSVESLARRLSTPALREMLHVVGEKVKYNKSSMFQDVEAGKQTEIREFNGWLIETAGFLGQDLDVSRHKALVDLVEQGVTLDESELGRRLLHR